MATTRSTARLDYRVVALASLPFMGMISFWQVYDGIVPKILTNTFGLDNSVTGAIMALDNLFGLFLLPFFGVLSDRCASRLGRRTPFILLGSALAVVAVPLIAFADKAESLPLLIAMILLTLFAICMYRTMTLAVVADITPRPLRSKADSIQKIVGYAGTGIMLVAIAVMVPSGTHPDYVPLFLMQAALIALGTLVFAWKVREPALVEKMHEQSLEFGIDEDDIERDDSPEAGGTRRITDRSKLWSIVMILGATFFYYMSYNAMTTNVSRYADAFFGMDGGSFAIINMTVILGALFTYVPMANLSLKIGRKKTGLIAGAIMVVCPLIVWLTPGFSPALYGVFLLMGVGLGAFDLCVYPMLLELCDSGSVGRCSGYYYTVSMAAQVVTPILSGVVMDVAPAVLFGYITLMSALMTGSLALARHGDGVLLGDLADKPDKGDLLEEATAALA